MPWNSPWAGAQTVTPPFASTASSFIDPDAATIILAPGVKPSPGLTRLRIRRGDGANYAIQCWNRGGLAAPSFQRSDLMIASVVQDGVVATVATPVVGWYAPGGTQTGYDQGQIVISIPAAQSTMQPSGGPVSYALVVTWASAAYPAATLTIVRLPLKVTAAF